MNDNHRSGFENFIFCSNESQKNRLNDIFEENESTIHYKTESCPLYEGFEDLDAKLACFTDHQIFERYHKYRVRSSAAKKEILTLKEKLNKILAEKTNQSLKKITSDTERDYFMNAEEVLTQRK